MEYALNTNTMTATLVWEFRHDPAIFTGFVGSVERRSSGNTVVGFGAAGIVVEVDPSGSVVWEGRLLVGGAPRWFYGVTTIRSLHRYERP